MPVSKIDMHVGNFRHACLMLVIFNTINFGAHLLTFCLVHPSIRRCFPKHDSWKQFFRWFGLILPWLLLLENDAKEPIDSMEYIDSTESIDSLDSLDSMDSIDSMVCMHSIHSMHAMHSMGSHESHGFHEIQRIHRSSMIDHPCSMIEKPVAPASIPRLVPDS